ncbi:MAG: VWA domain-containing protein [Pseudomonadota bacterium]
MRTPNNSQSPITVDQVSIGHSFIAQESLANTVMLRIIDFVRHARSNNFKVGVAEELDAQRLAALCDPSNQMMMRAGLKALLCSNEDDWKRFDALFDGFFHIKNIKSQYRESNSGVLNKEQRQPQAPQQQTPQQNHNTTLKQGISADSDAGTGDTENNDDGVREGASEAAILAKQDFQSLSDPDQMRAVERLVERLAKRMKRRISRRQRIQNVGKQLSLRATIRSSIRYGGEPLALKYKSKIKRQPRLVLIVDVSRSMSMYSFFFLRFARGLLTVFKDVSVFAYHTHLLPITEALRQTDLIRVRNSLAMMSEGWSGGTKIGESLAAFNQRYGQILNHRTVTMIVSDGLDTGSPEALSHQLHTIKRRCRRLIWLNPLLGRHGYEPKSSGIQAALPIIDLFAPAHNLESLAALEPELTAL